MGLRAGMAHAVVAEIGAAFRVVGAVALFAISLGAAATTFDDDRAGGVAVAIIVGAVVVIGARGRAECAADQRAGGKSGRRAAPAAAMMMPATVMVLCLRRRRGTGHRAGKHGGGEGQFRGHCKVSCACSCDNGRRPRPFLMAPDMTRGLRWIGASPAGSDSGCRILERSAMLRWLAGG